MVPGSVVSAMEVASAMMDSPVTTARAQRSVGHVEEAAKGRARVLTRKSFAREVMKVPVRVCSGLPAQLRLGVAQP